MALNVTIAGASYPDVPSIEVPKTGGGTAVFVDTSDANAVAGDIAKGKTAYVGGTKITGTLEASSPGAAKETWVIKDTAPVDENFYELARTDISFASGGTKFVAFGVYTDGVVIWLTYHTGANANIEVGSLEPGMGEDRFYWRNNAYKKLTFDTPPTGALLTWLQSNATKQPDDTAIQDTKALTITSNGTVSVTPDAPYDACKKVDVTVDVASGGSNGFKVTFPATAANWDKIDSGAIVQADGTVISLVDYSTLAGKTIPNVLEICCWGSECYSLRMTVQTGRIMMGYLSNMGALTSTAVDGESSRTYMGNGSTARWIPLADTVISAIEMYNTD